MADQGSAPWKERFTACNIHSRGRSFHQACSRDPFVKEGPNDQLEIKKVEPSKRFVVSSIIYSNSNALAVINGRIMAEGDTIYDQEFRLPFLIENIEDGRVEISDGEKKYTLQMALVAGKSSRVGL
jgi:hypothetical protein